MGIFDTLLPGIAKGIFITIVLVILAAVVSGELYETTAADLTNDTNLNNVYFGASGALEDFVGYLPLFVIAAVIMVIMIAVGMGRL